MTFIKIQPTGYLALLGNEEYVHLRANPPRLSKKSQARISSINITYLLRFYSPGSEENVSAYSQDSSGLNIKNINQTEGQLNAWSRPRDRTALHLARSRCTPSHGPGSPSPGTHTYAELTLHRGPASSNPWARWKGVFTDYFFRYQPNNVPVHSLTHRKTIQNLTSGRINSALKADDKGEQSWGSSPQAKRICQLASEVPALKGQLWSVWVSTGPGACWPLLRSLGTQLCYKHLALLPRAARLALLLGAKNMPSGGYRLHWGS